MGDTGEPPPGGGLHDTSGNLLAPTTTTPERSGGGLGETPRRMRNFEEILAEEKKNRNILIVKLTKIVTIENGEEVKEKSLFMEDVGELLFEVIKLKVEDCAGLSLSTSRYDTKEINLKPGIDPTPYLRTSPITFKGHLVTITQQRTDTIKVTFKNVPWDIPDEEIINLCEVYGTPVMNLVKYEPMPKAYRGVRGPNRTVEMKMKPGKQFENFYWMEGPLDSDRGSRVTVLHQGQEQQCSHCLRRGNCPGGGNGKACQLLNTPRGQIAEYMKYLKCSHNYLSLKMKFKLKKEQEFPALSRRNVEDDGFGHMVEEEADNLEDDDSIKTDDLEVKRDSLPLPGNILKVDPGDFEYDLKSDTVKPKNKKAFDNLVEQHPTVHTLRRGDNRDKKVAGLKAKVLDTLKVAERRKRALSCESLKSECSGWGVDDCSRERSGSRGQVRPRSEDEHSDLGSKKHTSQTKPILQPPKIVLSQN